MQIQDRIIVECYFTAHFKHNYQIISMLSAYIINKYN